ESKPLLPTSRVTMDDGGTSSEQPGKPNGSSASGSESPAKVFAFAGAARHHASAPGGAEPSTMRLCSPSGVSTRRTPTVGDGPALLQPVPVTCTPDGLQSHTCRYFAVVLPEDQVNANTG